MALISARCHAHAPHVLDLLPLGVPVRRVQLPRHLRQFRHFSFAFHNTSDVPTKHRFDLGEGHVRVLDRVVEEATDDGVAVHARLGEDGRYRHGMSDERLARPSCLPSMG